MKHSLAFYAVSLLLCLLAISCSITKRKYRKGFNVETGILSGKQGDRKTEKQMDKDTENNDSIALKGRDTSKGISADTTALKGLNVIENRADDNIAMKGRDIIEKPVTKKSFSMKDVMKKSGLFPFHQSFRMATELGFRENGSLAYEINGSAGSLGGYFYLNTTGTTPFYSMGFLWNFFEMGRHQLTMGFSTGGNPIGGYSYTFKPDDYLEYCMTLKALYSFTQPVGQRQNYRSFGTDTFIPLSLTFGMRFKTGR
jgi:hypothetical protein